MATVYLAGRPPFYATKQGKSMPKVYLAGPIESAPKEDTYQNWRVAAREQLEAVGLDSIDPYDHAVESDPSHPLHTDKSILVRSLAHVQRCDLVLVYTRDCSKRSFGTAMEIAWAYQFGTPVIHVTDELGAFRHPMLDAASTVIVDSLVEAVRCAELILKDH